MNTHALHAGSPDGQEGPRSRSAALAALAAAPPLSDLHHASQWRPAGFEAAHGRLEDFLRREGGAATAGERIGLDKRERCQSIRFPFALDVSPPLARPPLLLTSLPPCSPPFALDVSNTSMC